MKTTNIEEMIGEPLMEHTLVGIEDVKDMCPLTLYSCKRHECKWWVTDYGTEECAIVKMAKGAW
jgi:hypothetical protein